MLKDPRTELNQPFSYLTCDKNFTTGFHTLNITITLGVLTRIHPMSRSVSASKCVDFTGSVLAFSTFGALMHPIMIKPCHEL